VRKKKPQGDKKKVHIHILVTLLRPTEPSSMSLVFSETHAKCFSVFSIMCRSAKWLAGGDPIMTRPESLLGNRARSIYT
jgi:hypothetical protein